jgi:hypothetical protein
MHLMSGTIELCMGWAIIGGCAGVVVALAALVALLVRIASNR